MSMDPILGINHLNKRFSTEDDLHGLRVAKFENLGGPTAAGQLAVFNPNGQIPTAGLEIIDTSYATNIVTLAGTPTAGDTVTITVAGIANTYTVLLGDTLNDVAVALAGLINADTDLNTTVSAADSGATVVITSLIPGNPGNSIPVSVSTTGVITASVPGGTLGGGSLTLIGAGQYATGSVTIGDSPAPSPGDILTVTINGNAVQYTVLAGDTPSDVAVAAAAEINADATASTIVSATSSGATVLITAIVAGAPGNAITLSASITGSSSATASGATLGGGAAPVESSSGGMSSLFLLGTINTVGDDTFVLPSWAGTQEVIFLDRVKGLRNGTDYTRSGNTITLTPPINPGVGNTLELWAMVSIGDITQNADLIGYSDFEPCTVTGNPDIYDLPVGAWATNDIKVYVGLVPVPRLTGVTENWQRISASQIEFLTETPADDVHVQFAVATLAIPASSVKQEFMFSAFGDIDVAVTPADLDGVRRSLSNIVLDDFVVVVEDNGTSGTSSFDLQKASTPNGAFTSVLSAPVSITAAAGDYASASGTLTTTNFPAGTWFKVVLTGVAVDLAAVRAFVGWHQA